MVTSNHNWFYSCFLTLLNSDFSFLAWRVNHSYHTDKNEFAFSFFCYLPNDFISEFTIKSDFFICHTQHPKRILSHLSIGIGKIIFIIFRQYPHLIFVFYTITPHKQFVKGSHCSNEYSVFRSTMNRCHQFSVRIKWYFRNTRINLIAMYLTTVVCISESHNSCLCWLTI